MPSLYGAGVRIHLASQLLAPSLTDEIQLKKGYAAAAKVERAEKALRESAGALLPEERVPFPADEGRFAVNWLGGVPFLQVVVRENVESVKKGLGSADADAGYLDGRRSSQGPSTRSGRLAVAQGVEHEMTGSSALQGSPMHDLPIPRSPYSIQPHSYPEPKALVLHVMLTDKTFFYNPFDNNPQHLKIDVLFNGQLSNTALIHTVDIKNGTKSLNQVFAGTRIDYMAERPWVVHAPEPGGGVGNQQQSIGNGAQTRWREICEALKDEVKARGVDKDGVRPPTAAYLEELAGMKMPDMVMGMQRPRGRKFGVVDVVITVGTGKKTTSNVAYLKEPTRLVDERFCYESNDAGHSKSTPAVGTTSETPAADTRGHGIEHASDQKHGVLDHNVIFTGLPTSSGNGLPLPPPEAALPWHNPFTGSPIPPLASLGPSTSFIRQSTFEPEMGELSHKRGCFESSALSGYREPRAETNHQMPLRQTYPSAHGPNVPPRSSIAPTLRQTAFNVNQYDSFEHANPYQPPYTGLMTGLDFAAFDGPTSSPLRHGSGGHLTLPSFVPTPEEVTPSPTASSTLPSSYSMPMLSSTQGSGAIFAPGTSPYNSTATSVGNGVWSPGQQPQPSFHQGYGFVRPDDSNFVPPGAAPRPFSPYASVPYMPPPTRRPSNGPPPPVGLFKVTEKPKVEIPTDPLAAARDTNPSGIVRRLVIRLGARVVVSHQFTKATRISPKISVENSTRGAAPEKALKESPGSAEWIEDAGVRRRSNRAGESMAIPVDMSSTGINDKASKSSGKMKKDSVHDGSTGIQDLLSRNMITERRAGSTSTVLMSSNPTTTPSGTYTYTPMHRTADTGILGVQGPKANLFVIDNPEELLRKKKPRLQSSSRSVSPTKVATQTEEKAAGSVQATESRDLGRLKDSKSVDDRSSSPLSELSHSPQLSTTADPSDANTNAQINLPSLPPPVGANPEASANTPGLNVSVPISSPTKVVTAPLPPATLPSQPKTSISKSASSKRKRTGTSTYVKQPRSPDRLSAKDNPPLNRDCVIQYATSLREGEALRQIRYERRGVFREESVVVGVRFFVGGC